MSETANHSARRPLALAALAIVVAAGIASVGCAAAAASEPGPKTAKWHVLDDDGVPITRTHEQRGGCAGAHEGTAERAADQRPPARATCGYYGSPLDFVKCVGEAIRFVADLIRILGCLR
jgi:hypothetical protein